MSEQDKHSKRCHRIYLAGSWKNQQEIFLIRDILKTQGHEVDCFASEENGRISFNWSKLPDIQDKLPKMDAKDMLEVPRVQEAFREDKKWIDWCDLCLLTLPSGKSSHLEAGYAKGQGKTVVIFGDLKKGDFDVMYGFADAIFRCDELDQMVDFVNSNDSSTILTAEKDDVHWITGAELREIYADNLSLDKYDEIRKRSPPASVKILPEKPCDICLLNDLAANDYEKLKAHDAAIRKEMAKTISDILDREWMCSLNEIKYILDCVANGNVDPFKDRPEKGADPK